LALEEVIVQL